MDEYYVTGVELLDRYRLHLTFEDGTRKIVDIEPYLTGGPVFGPLRDPDLFRQVHVEYGTIAWPNGADIAPETLYYGGPPPWSPDAVKS